MHKVGPKIWIARIMLTWGIVVILTGFAQTTTHLYILRFLLGVAETGFFPGVILYLTICSEIVKEEKQLQVLLLLRCIYRNLWLVIWDANYY